MSMEALAFVRFAPAPNRSFGANVGLGVLQLNFTFLKHFRKLNWQFSTV